MPTIEELEDALRRVRARETYLSSKLSRDTAWLDDGVQRLLRGEIVEGGIRERADAVTRTAYDLTAVIFERREVKLALDRALAQGASGG